MCIKQTSANSLINPCQPEPFEKEKKQQFQTCDIETYVMIILIRTMYARGVHHIDALRCSKWTCCKVGKIGDPQRVSPAVMCSEFNGWGGNCVIPCCNQRGLIHHCYTSGLYCNRHHVREKPAAMSLAVSRCLRLPGFLMEYDRWGWIHISGYTSLTQWYHDCDAIIILVTTLLRQRLEYEHALCLQKVRGLSSPGRVFEKPLENSWQSVETKVNWVGQWSVLCRRHSNSQHLYTVLLIHQSTFIYCTALQQKFTNAFIAYAYIIKIFTWGTTPTAWWSKHMKVAV